jgi:hypothetical protein
MLNNIGCINTVVIYCHSTVITKAMLLYNTEWQYDHGMAVTYCGKKFNNNGSWLQLNFTYLMKSYRDQLYKGKQNKIMKNVN